MNSMMGPKSYFHIDNHFKKELENTSQHKTLLPTDVIIQ